MVKKIFLHNLFSQKCVFYACFLLIGSWEGVRVVRVGLQETNNFFLGLNILPSFQH